jgi:hypothetical protein
MPQISSAMVIRLKVVAFTRINAGPTVECRRNMVKVHEAQIPKHKLDLEPWILSLVRGRHP